MMKTCSLRTFLLAFALVTKAFEAQSQTYTILHNFAETAIDAATSQPTNSDGDEPHGHLVVAGNTIYGVASNGGTNTVGTVFRLDIDGGDFTNLFTFGYDEAGGYGSAPQGGLLLVGNTLYGTTADGTSNLTGTIFAIQTDGTGFSNLYKFTARVDTTNSDGANPQAALTLVGNMLYGTASAGGAFGYGSVFGIETNGTGFTNLHSFGQTDGATPECTLVASGNMLYGTTKTGGPAPNTNGTIFAISTNGLIFSTYHSFTPVSAADPTPTNYDGANPTGSLTLSGGTLYGATDAGGASDYGTIYAINTDGTGFRAVYSFVAPDGVHPNSDLVVTDGTIYGTTLSGSKPTNSGGTIFSVGTDGGGFTNLVWHKATGFNGIAGYTNVGGAGCVTGMTYSGGVFYGVDSAGGTNGAGLVYSLSLGGSAPEPIPLNIQSSAGTLVLTWTATNAVLQASQNLNTGFTNVTGAASPFTVAPTNAQQFFRLLVN
jgi:uncharacterized repeat protein (TIGR03803 family)